MLDKWLKVGGFLFKKYSNGVLFNKVTKELGIPTFLFGLTLYGLGEDRTLLMIKTILCASLFDQILCFLFSIAFVLIFVVTEDQLNRIINGWKYFTSRPKYIIIVSLVLLGAFLYSKVFEGF